MVLFKKQKFSRTRSLHPFSGFREALNFPSCLRLTFIWFWLLMAFLGDALQGVWAFWVTCCRPLHTHSQLWWSPAVQAKLTRPWFSLLLFLLVGPFLCVCPLPNADWSGTWAPPPCLCLGSHCSFLDILGVQVTLRNCSVVGVSSLSILSCPKSQPPEGLRPKLAEAGCSVGYRRDSCCGPGIALSRGVAHASCVVKYSCPLGPLGT